jgi:hypothetical protein
MMPNADKIIDALGGTTKVADKTKAAPSTVHSWREKVTPSRLAHLLLLADSEGIAYSYDAVGSPIPHSAGDTVAANGPETGKISEVSSLAGAL